MPGVTSTDESECDQANPSYHRHNEDNVTGADPHPLATPLLAPAAFAQKTWPSVARCAAGAISSDEFPCDNSARPNILHDHANVTGATPHPLATPLLAPAAPAPAAFVQVDAEEAARIVSAWPSVARCSPDEVPSDEFPCDHSNAFRLHNHDNVTGVDPHALATPLLAPAPPAVTVVQVDEAISTEYRPKIKCKDPLFGNPISCDYNDITSVNSGRKKDVFLMTPTKVVVGGPTMNYEPVIEAASEADK